MASNIPPTWKPGRRHEARTPSLGCASGWAVVPVLDTLAAQHDLHAYRVTADLHSLNSDKRCYVPAYGHDPSMFALGISTTYQFCQKRTLPLLQMPEASENPSLA